MGRKPGKETWTEQEMDMSKIIILGGRSGTSTLARLLQVAGLDLWCTTGTIEPPYIQGTILKNVYNPDRIKKALTINKTWNVAKLPEFSFCLPILHDVFPDAKYIWMRRPIDDRVKSHVNLGWHYSINERITEDAELKHFIEKTTGAKIGKDEKKNDILYFYALDLLTEAFFKNRPHDVLKVQYDRFNSDFSWTMRNIATYIDVSFYDNIDTWKKIKAIPQQAGRWQSAPSH